MDGFHGLERTDKPGQWTICSGATCAISPLETSSACAEDFSVTFSRTVDFEGCKTITQWLDSVKTGTSVEIKVEDGGIRGPFYLVGTDSQADPVDSEGTVTMEGALSYKIETIVTDDIPSEETQAMEPEMLDELKKHPGCTAQIYIKMGVLPTEAVRIRTDSGLSE